MDGCPDRHAPGASTMLPLPPMLALSAYTLLALLCLVVLAKRTRHLPKWASRLALGLAGAGIGFLATFSTPVVADWRRLEYDLVNGFQHDICLEGATANAYQTCIHAADPTADRTFTIPNATGNVFVSGADIVFQPNLAGGADIYPEAADAGAAGSTLDIVGGAGGSPLIVLDGGLGRNGGNLTLTGGAGTDVSGAANPAGAGGDVVLTGGARGGTTGSPNIGVVRVGSPTIGLTRAVDLLAVAGGIETDGPILFAGSQPNGDTVLTVSACGVDQFVGAAGDDFTLPAPTMGCRIRFIMDTAFATTNMTVVTASSANVIFGAIDVNSSLVLCASRDTVSFVNTAETVGDYVEFRSDGTSWFLSGMCAAAGGCTCTQAS